MRPLFCVLTDSPNHQSTSPRPHENDDDDDLYVKDRLQYNDDTPLEDEHEEEDEEEHKSMAALEAELEKYLSDEWEHLAWLDHCQVK